jgi:hypothetical protein
MMDHKFPLLTELLTLFYLCHVAFRLIIINHRTFNEPADLQHGTRIFEFPHQVDALVVTSTANTYIKISTRSCLKTLGAGGTTAKSLKPPLILGSAGALQFKVTGVLMDLA